MQLRMWKGATQGDRRSHWTQHGCGEGDFTDT